jgi:hypothetical protein
MILEALVLLVSFIFTLVIEYAVLAGFVRTPPAQTALYTFLINAVTWPIANILFAFFGNIVAVLILIEAGVILAEAVLISLLFETGRRRSLLLSFMANSLSALFSLLLFVLL